MKPDPATIMSSIPAQVLGDDRIGPAAKILFGCIYSLALHYPKCFISNRILSERMNLDQRQVRRLLRDLQSAGLIERQFDEKHHREEIRVTWQPGSLVIRKRTKMSEGGEDKSVRGGRTNLSGGEDKSVRGHSVIENTNRDQKSKSRSPRVREEPATAFSVPDLIEKARAIFEGIAPGKVHDVIAEYGPEWVGWALDRAKKKQPDSWGYVLAMLKGWRETGPPKPPRPKPVMPYEVPYMPPPPVKDPVAPQAVAAQIKDLIAGVGEKPAR